VSINFIYQELVDLQKSIKYKLYLEFWIYSSFFIINPNNNRYFFSYEFS